MLRHFLNPPNWFTSASIFCSSYALMLVAGAPHVDADILRRACTLIIFGGIFDLLDGRVARITNRYTEFGVQLDSIADIVGFGVAPAIIAYVWKLQSMGTAGAVVAFLYVLAAAFRLARFNVNKGDTDECVEWELAGHSEGLTSTMAGGCLVTAVWLANGYLENVLDVPAPMFAAFVLFLGFLMISRLPMRTFRDLRDNRLARLILAVSLSVCTLGAVVHPSLWWGIGAGIYLTAGVIDGMVVAVHSQRVKKALMVDEVERALEGRLYEDDDDA
ncbi:MAG: phosphatidylcholine/phosphatidylserine synthase [Myxococcales bacterium]|nr:phosphatidylcholine/phosphatidylserine synthase [Myxococcales bacterium]MCB9694194.1 phosphatidylcholine/phosphatidylserine synthase [Alphaproteobacteria bacterium]